MPWALRGLRNGVVTTRYPRHPDDYADTFRGAVVPRDVDGDVGGDVGGDADAVAALCPTGAISAGPRGVLRVDAGRCILCGRCVQARPDLVTWAAGSQTASLGREALVVPEAAETVDALAQVRRDLAARTAMLRRSVHVRHVDAGSDGADEWEVLALQGPVYDVQRLGIFFTASPRHADVLLVTGAGAHGMALPLQRTVEATPRPVVVIAAGVDAISGGLVAPGYAVAGGVAGLVDVDIWVPGSPPSPFSLLHALLLGMGRLTPDRGRSP